MNKLFKPKTMRRILLFMALIFPVVYLCGGLFFALNGAHGYELFADSLTNSVQQDIDTENRRFWNGQGGYGSWFSYTASQKIDFVEDSLYSVKSFESVNTLTRIVVNYWDSDGNHISQSSLDITLPVNIPVVGASFALSFGTDADLPLGYSSFVLDIVGTPSFKVNYSDYLFSSPFASNNFVSTVGRDVMNGSADGFAPMNDLFRIVNDNVLHFDENDSLAVFGFGYLYYAVNVIVIYEVVTIALKLLLLPLKVVDKLEVEKDA